MTRRQRPRVHTSITALALSCLSRRPATTRFRYGLRTSRHEAGRHVKTREDAGKHRHVPLIHPPPPRALRRAAYLHTFFVLIYTPMLESSTSSSYSWLLLHGAQTFEMSIAGTAYSDPRLNQQSCRVLEEATVRPSARPPAPFIIYPSRKPAARQPQVATAKEESGGQLGSGEG